MAENPSHSIDWNVETVKELMNHMAKTGLGELTLEDESFRLTLSARQAVQTVQPVPAAAVPAPAAPIRPELPPEPAPPEQPEGKVIRSPIVGTFYAAASPDKPPFAQVGSRVKKGDTLFIIESMKLMNEIQSEFEGEVAEVLVENGQGVEYNQPIMVLR